MKNGIAKEPNHSPLGEDWKDFKKVLLSSEERDEIDLKAQVISEILKARHEQGLTQKQLEEASGVQQPVIARMEKGTTDPQLMTILKVLRPLGKTLAIVPLKKHNAK